MATCSPSDLVAGARCFSCIAPRQLEVIKASLLCQILQIANPMASCDAASLIADGKCFAALTADMLAVVQTQLLCEILNAGGGGGGQSCIICANVDPTTAPTCACALYYRKDNMAVWLWNADTLTWDQLIAP